MTSQINGTYNIASAISVPQLMYEKISIVAVSQLLCVGIARDHGCTCDAIPSTNLEAHMSGAYFDRPKSPQMPASIPDNDPGYLDLLNKI